MKGTRLHPDFAPDQNLRQWAESRRPDLDIAEQTEMFLNHWLSKTGQDATKLDWERTYKNWIIRSYGPIKKRLGEVSGAKPIFRSEPRQRVTEEPQAMKDLLMQMGMVNP